MHRFLLKISFNKNIGIRIREVNVHLSQVAHLLDTPTKFPQNREIEKEKQSCKTKKSNLKLRLLSAVRTRLELVTSCVTGRHSNQLN